MTEVDRLMSELNTLFGSNPSEVDLKLYSHFYLSAFIGRVVSREDRYAPPDEVLPVFQDARNAIHQIRAQGHAVFVRIELLSELDRAIAYLRPKHFQQPKLE